MPTTSTRGCCDGARRWGARAGRLLPEHRPGPERTLLVITRLAYGRAG